MAVERVPLAVVAGVVGWLVGWASAWFTAWLESGDTPDDQSAQGTGGVDTVPGDEIEARGAEQTPNGAAVRRLARLIARDPLVQGGCAVAWALAALVLTGDWWRPFEAGLIAVPLIQVAVTDLRTRYVYTIVAAVGIVLGLAFGWHVHATEPWTSAAGAAGGFLSFGALWLLGRLLYRGRLEAMARGDITIATMVGAGAAVCTPQALFWGVLIGGLFAVGMLVARRSGKAYMPYGPGLCAGGLVALFLC